MLDSGDTNSEGSHETLHLQVADEQTPTGSQMSAREKKPKLSSNKSSTINEEDEIILTDLNEKFDGPGTSRGNRNASHYADNNRGSLSGVSNEPGGGGC